MIRRTKVNPSRVEALAQTQISALKANPDLDKGIKVPLVEIEAMLAKAATAVVVSETLAKVEAQLAKVLAAESARDELKNAALAATDALRKAEFELRLSVLSNIDAVVRRRGRYEPDIALLGRKPAANGRRTLTEES